MAAFTAMVPHDGNAKYIAYASKYMRLSNNEMVMVKDRFHLYI
jgi:hypothetical protein